MSDLDDRALKQSIGFRRVYATALDKWLGIDSVAVLGRQFEPLDGFET